MVSMTAGRSGDVRPRLSLLGLALSILIQSGRWNPGPEWHGHGLAGLLSHRGDGSRCSSCPFSRDIKVRARARAWYRGGGGGGRSVKKVSLNGDCYKNNASDARNRQRERADDQSGELLSEHFCADGSQAR